jgi:hypothetical protein
MKKAVLADACIAFPPYVAGTLMKAIFILLTRFFTRLLMEESTGLSLIQATHMFKTSP